MFPKVQVGLREDHLGRNICQSYPRRYYYLNFELQRLGAPQGFTTLEYQLLLVVTTN